MLPEIKKDYDFSKNKDVNTDLLSVSSSESVWWHCHKCGYDWKAAPVARAELKDSKYVVGNCPACIGSARTQTYAEEYPELDKRFIENKNGCKLADLSGSDTKKIYWWHCNICGEDFDSSLSGMIRSRNTQNKGCSYCASKKVRRENSFASLHPEIMDEFDIENTIDPYNVVEHSSRKAKWVCRINPEHKWIASFDSRSKGVGNCNICRGYRYNLMFCDEHPEFEIYYDSEKNIRSFKSYSNMSNDLVWWRCEEGHSFQWAVYYFSRNGYFECPICTNKELVSGINDLLSREPLLAKEFDTKRNRITPDKVSIKSWDESIWWICQKGHHYQRSISYRINYNRECPVCTREIVIKNINDFETKYPDIKNIWDYEKNERRPDNISDTNKNKFYFVCDKGHQYESYLTTILAHNFECPVCNYKKIEPTINSLLVTDYDLSLEFSPNEVRKPTEFTKKSAYSILWKCKKCKNDYKYPIKDRRLGDNCCPFCNNRYTKYGVNSLVDTHSDLAKEYAEDNEYDVTRVNKNSKTWAYWYCPKCGERYGAYVNERELNDDSCPYCNGKRAVPGVNSFAVNHQDLVKYWDYVNNYILVNPDQILDTCSEKVWWFCELNSNHKYQMSPKQKILLQKRHMTSCSICKGYRRKRIHFV